ncbi:MAG: glycosyltransferase family 39 protein [Solirubrobacterales bacterium]|nr:glycosyltransferase family 39 protein [Solirubrobacterales bacterium]
MALAALLRLSTLDLQSLWYDEAFTPVHVLHPSVWATLRSVAHTENSPPLWYLLEWADTRVLGSGEIALRLSSALIGIATVPIAWAIGRELAGRRAALLCGAIVAVNPLFVWYSQEARVYALFVLTSAVAILCFLRAATLEPTDPASPRRLAAFALSGAVALLTHYFAVFLLIPMVLWLARDRARLRAAAGAITALVLVGLALGPLIATQGGHGTQWIGRWPISERLQAIPQYFLTGYSGAPLGHGVELLVALLVLGACGFGFWRISAPAVQGAHIDEGDGRRERRGALVMAMLAAAGVLTPVVLALLGADYLAPRNLVAAMIPISALIAVLAAAPRGGWTAVALAGAMLLAFLAISIDVELSPRLQRGNWRDVARALGAGDRARAISTVELGAAPLEYYLPSLRNLRSTASVRVSEIDETGYAPLRASAGEPPAPGFHLFAHLEIDGLIVYRFRSARPRIVSEAALRRHVITLARPEVLVPVSARLSA